MANVELELYSTYFGVLSFEGLVQQCVMKGSISVYGEHALGSGDSSNKCIRFLVKLANFLLLCCPIKFVSGLSTHFSYCPQQPALYDLLEIQHFLLFAAKVFRIFHFNKKFYFLSQSICACLCYTLTLMLINSLLNCR